MSSESERGELMNLDLQVITEESLLSVFRPFVNDLTALQWFKIKFGVVDETVKQIITDLCVEIVHVVSTNTVLPRHWKVMMDHKKTSLYQ